MLAHGVEEAGFELLAQARRQYQAWGASAKVDQLDWAYPTLRPRPDATGGQPVQLPGDLPEGRAEDTTGTLDLLGIVSASQALSAQTSIHRLHARVVEVLGAMTGATGLRLLLWSEDRQAWLRPSPDGGAAPISGTGHELEVPMSVLRYVQRSGGPLVVVDASGDDRFARDPYFTDLNCCALLAVPILSRGSPRAVLLLENRLLRGAFTADRLDGVKLVAGQLAVSLDNAQLYAELTASRGRIVAAADQARRRIERELSGRSGAGHSSGALPSTVLGDEHAGVDCVSEACETLGWIRSRGRALGADRLDRRGTRPGDPTLVASPRRVALHAAQRRRPRSVATSTLMSGEAAASASWTRSALDMHVDHCHRFCHRERVDRVQPGQGSWPSVRACRCRTGQSA